MLNTSNKIIPLMASGWLTFSIYMCPCETLLSCKKESSIIVLLSLLAMIVLEYPTPHVN